MNRTNRIETIGRTAHGGDHVKTLTIVLLVLFCMWLTYYCHFVRRIDLVFTHFFYVPIILAGFWWWRWGVWVAAILGGCVVVSHGLAGLDTALTADVLRCAMFIVVGLVTGILRKQCDEAGHRALRETRDYLDSLIRHSSVPIIVWDNQGKITVFNGAFEQLTGYRAEEMAGQSPEVLIPEEKWDEALRKIEATLKGDSWKGVEIPIVGKDGRVAICLWNSANIYSPDGKTLMATMAQGVDITERKRAEEELRENYETQNIVNLLLRLPLEGIPLQQILKGVLELILSIPWLALQARGAIFLVEEDPGVLVLKAQSGLGEAVQKACARVPLGKCLCGRAVSMKELQFAECVDDRHDVRYEGIGRHGHYCVPILTGGCALGVMTFYLEEGHRRSSREEAFLRAMADILAGITERKRAEERLAQTQEKLMSILNGMSDYCHIISKDYRVDFVNKAGVERFGDRTGDICYKALFDRGSPCPWCTLAEVQEGKTVRWEHSSPTLEATFDIIDTPLANRDGSISKLGIWRDISERKGEEDQVKASLKEKELLLKEVHHRIKNNLQVLSSLLNLQLQYIKDAKAIEMFKESRNRIKSMAFIYEELHRSKQLSNVGFREYVQNLAGALIRSYGVGPQRIALAVDADDVPLGVDAAITCGLMVNELVSNALKHAFPEGRDGEIRIGFHRESDNRFALTVSDNGVGFPKDVDFRNAGSLGLQLVCTLTDQMHGAIEIHRTGGTEFRITFMEASG